MKSSYAPEEVTLLLKDITGQIDPLDTKEREEKIQQGVHYSEMLPKEYRPTPAYLKLYEEALQQHAGITASAIKSVAEKIRAKRGNEITLVSLARAGTPIGILIKRYLEATYGVSVSHYTISIIRGRGIDQNAMHHILSQHSPQSIQFVDGWIGKGAIIRELEEAVKDFPQVDASLAVLADPARLTELYGTSEDFLIPSSCLNATVSGLFSRTILNHDVIGPQDYHGAVYFSELEVDDVSNAFLDTVTRAFDTASILPEKNFTQGQDVKRIMQDFGVQDINFVKPGIGETTRVLLRRVPWKILVNDLNDEVYIGHIKRLCQEKEVECIEYPLENYRACGLIRDLSADV